MDNTSKLFILAGTMVGASIVFLNKSRYAEVKYIQTGSEDDKYNACRFMKYCQLSLISSAFVTGVAMGIIARKTN